MKRLAVLLMGSLGCVDAADEINGSPAPFANTEAVGAELGEDEAIDEISLSMSASASTASFELEREQYDPTGRRCGAPIGTAMDTVWVWGQNGMPVGLQVDVSEPVATLTVEFRVLNGASVDENVVQRMNVEGKQVVELAQEVLAQAADFAAEGKVPFASVTAIATVHDSAGEVVAAGDASTVHFKRDNYGGLIGFSPVAAADAFSALNSAVPELKDAYPEVVVIDGAVQESSYIRVFRSNPGE